MLFLGGTGGVMGAFDGEEPFCCFWDWVDIVTGCNVDISNEILDIAPQRNYKTRLAKEYR